MAAAKIRDRNIPIADFEMPLSDALALLLSPSEVQGGDNWHIQTVGDRLVFTRERAAIPNAAGASQGKGRV